MIKNYSETVKSCAIAFVCVCEHLLKEDQLQSWAKGETNPNDFIDANVVLDQIIVNHGIETFNIDGEITDEIADFFNTAFDQANELIREKRKPDPVESSYTLENFFMSMHDIYEQFDGNKIDTKEATELSRKCCNEFLINGEIK